MPAALLLPAERLLTEFGSEDLSNNLFVVRLLFLAVDRVAEDLPAAEMVRLFWVVGAAEVDLLAPWSQFMQTLLSLLALRLRAQSLRTAAMAEMEPTGLTELAVEAEAAALEADIFSLPIITKLAPWLRTLLNVTEEMGAMEELALEQIPVLELAETVETVGISTP
jgi:hypothetical protein